MKKQENENGPGRGTNKRKGYKKGKGQKTTEKGTWNKKPEKKTEGQGKGKAMKM